jgi:hypothetical protein
VPSAKCDSCVFYTFRGQTYVWGIHRFLKKIMKIYISASRMWTNIPQEWGEMVSTSGTDYRGTCMFFLWSANHCSESFIFAETNFLTSMSMSVCLPSFAKQVQQISTKMYYLWGDMSPIKSNWVLSPGREFKRALGCNSWQPSDWTRQA